MSIYLIIYIVVSVLLGIIKSVKFTIEMIGHMKSFIERFTLPVAMFLAETIFWPILFAIYLYNREMAISEILERETGRQL